MITRRYFIALLPAITVLAACKPKSACPDIDTQAVDRVIEFAGKITPLARFDAKSIDNPTIIRIRALAQAVGQSGSGDAAATRTAVSKAVAEDISSGNFAQLANSDITRTEFALMSLAAKAVSKEDITSKC